MADLALDNAQTAATVVATPAGPVLFAGLHYKRRPGIFKWPDQSGGHTVCVRKKRKIERHTGAWGGGTACVDHKFALHRS